MLVFSCMRSVKKPEEEEEGRNEYFSQNSSILVALQQNSPDSEDKPTGLFALWKAVIKACEHRLRNVSPCKPSSSRGRTQCKAWSSAYAYSAGNANPRGWEGRPGREQGAEEGKKSLWKRLCRVTYGSTGARPPPARSRGCRHSWRSPGCSHSDGHTWPCPLHTHQRLQAHRKSFRWLSK